MLLPWRRSATLFITREKRGVPRCLSRRLDVELCVQDGGAFELARQALEGACTGGICIETGARQDRIDPVPLAALDLAGEARRDRGAVLEPVGAKAVNRPVAVQKLSLIDEILRPDAAVLEGDDAEHLAHNHRLALYVRCFEGLHLERMNDVPELDNLFAGQDGHRCGEEDGCADKESERVKLTHGNTFL
jgi:hypothetical protein